MPEVRNVPSIDDIFGVSLDDFFQRTLAQRQAQRRQAFALNLGRLVGNSLSGVENTGDITDDLSAILAQDDSDLFELLTQRALQERQQEVSLRDQDVRQNEGALERLLREQEGGLDREAALKRTNIQAQASRDVAGISAAAQRQSSADRLLSFLVSGGVQAGSLLPNASALNERLGSDLLAPGTSSTQATGATIGDAAAAQQRLRERLQTIEERFNDPTLNDGLGF